MLIYVYLSLICSQFRQKKRQPKYEIFRLSLELDKNFYSWNTRVTKSLQYNCESCAVALLLNRSLQ